VLNRFALSPTRYLPSVIPVTAMGGVYLAERLVQGEGNCTVRSIPKGASTGSDIVGDGTTLDGDTLGVSERELVSVQAEGNAEGP
jgi:hypothetical protein